MFPSIEPPADPNTVREPANPKPSTVTDMTQSSGPTPAPSEETSQHEILRPEFASPEEAEAPAEGCALASPTTNNQPSAIDQAPPTLVEEPAARASKPKSRNGKIARLPYLERDMVNRMLRNNISHQNIADALEEQGFTVTPRNISNWKTRGGYREWCLEQDRALQNRLMQENLTEYLLKENASQLPEVGLQLAATQLSRFLLKTETQQQLASEPEKHVNTISMLCRLARQIHALQQYRDQAAGSTGFDNHPARRFRKAEAEIEKLRQIYSTNSGRISKTQVFLTATLSPDAHDL